MFQEQWQVPAGFTSWLLRFAFGARVSLVLLLSRVNDAQFSLSQGNAWISGGLEPSILCCHCPSPVSPPSAPSLSEKSSSLLTEGHSWNWGGQIRKTPPPRWKTRVFLEWISAISCSSISRQRQTFVQPWVRVCPVPGRAVSPGRCPPRREFTAQTLQTASIISACASRGDSRMMEALGVQEGVLKKVLETETSPCVPGMETTCGTLRKTVSVV